MDPATAPTALHEAVLYADDIEAAATFYTEVIGLRAVFGPNALMVALRVDPATVLLVFEPGAAARPERAVPSHGTTGEGHVAFTVSEVALSAILERAAARGAGVERELTWPRGGRSVYLRDPAQNSVELVVGEIWEP